MPVFNVGVTCKEVVERTCWVCVDADSEADARLAAEMSLDQLRETAFFRPEMRAVEHCIEMHDGHRLYPRVDMVDVVAQRYGDEFLVDVLR